jgi:hypothetical protein
MPAQSSTSMENRLCYIFTHVDTAFNPLHHHSHCMSHSSSNCLSFILWATWNLQEYSGEYYHHVDNSFAVIGPILNATSSRVQGSRV